MQSSDYGNFSNGGMNSVSNAYLLPDNEFSVLNNIDIGLSGDLSRRYGMKKYWNNPIKGFGQGFFRLIRRGRKPLEIRAVSGKLYQDPIDSITLNETQTYTYARSGVDANGKGFRIIKVSVPNAKVGGNVTITDSANSPYQVVVGISKAKQVSLVSSKEFEFSLADSETNWTYNPSSNDVQAFLYGNNLELNYEVESTLIPIVNLPSGFQTKRPIEAIQYKNKLIIATGTKLVEFDGAVAKVITPYTPTPLEVLYVGTNGLADDPNNYIQDGVASALRIEGVTSTLRQGIINTPTDLKIYISKPSSMVNVEYKFANRKVGEADFKTVQDWSANKTFTFTPTSTGDYEFDCYVRDASNTNTTARFIVPKYTVYADNKNQTIDTSAINNCTRIILHWERIIVYGDDTNNSMMYVSDLKKTDYFPVPNTLQFDTRNIEPLTALVRYRDMLVAFTETTIQAVYGKSPSDFTRIVLNSTVGCIAPYSAQVFQNQLIFLAKDGINILESVGTTEERANVSRIDLKISNLVYKDKNAVGVVHDHKYHLIYPDRETRLRCYVEQNVAWVIDTSTKLDFTNAYDIGGTLYGQSKKTGDVYVFDPTIFDDDGYVYEDRIETKEYDLGTPYLQKKLKQLRMMFRNYGVSVNSNLYVFADRVVVVNPERTDVQIIDGKIVQTSGQKPNLILVPATNNHGDVILEPNILTEEQNTILGQWLLGRSSFGVNDVSTKFMRVQGECTRVKFTLLHIENKPFGLLGFGFEFDVSQNNRGK